MTEHDENRPMHPAGELLRLIRKMAVSRLSEFAHLAEIDSYTVTNLDRDLSHDHWVSTINLIYPGLEVTFRAHFSSKLARSLTARVLDANQLSSSVCHSFMTEYCNLTGGGIKNLISQALNAPTKESQLSLPENKPSYDDADLPSDTDPHSHAWLCVVDDEELIGVGTVSVIPSFLEQHYGLTINELSRRLGELNEQEDESDPDSFLT